MGMLLNRHRKAREGAVTTKADLEKEVEVVEAPEAVQEPEEEAPKPKAKKTPSTKGA